MKYLHTQRLLRRHAVLLAVLLLLLAGCGRSDQFGDELTPQPDVPTQDAAVAPAALDVTPDTVEPTQDAAVAPEPIAPAATADGAYPGPDGAVAVAPDAASEQAYPAPPTVTPAPGDELGFVDYPAGEIGVIIDARNNTVVEVIENSPAQAAGIKVGDIITQVEDTRVGDKFKDAKEKMTDKLNKQVKVEIERQGKKSILNMKTDVLIFPTVAPDQPTPTPVYDPFIYL